MAKRAYIPVNNANGVTPPNARNWKKSRTMVDLMVNLSLLVKKTYLFMKKHMRYLFED